MKKIPFGTWHSPITAQKVAAGTKRLEEIEFKNGNIYFLEGRPSEKGRVALMSWPEKELLPKEFSVRSRVHEYGGGALLAADTTVYFINDADQQIYSLDKKITDRKNSRFADGCYHDGVLYYVMEEHLEAVVNSIVKIKDGKIEKIVEGNDFYASPRVSPNGQFLAYITWNHPNLPWDETELWVLDLKSGEKRLIAGDGAAVVDPKWSPQNELYYVSDKNNWWNIYKEGELVVALDAEFAFPHWVFGRSLYGFTDQGIFSAYIKNGEAHIGDLPFSLVKNMRVDDDKVLISVSSKKCPLEIVLYDCNTKSYKTIKSSCCDKIPEEFICEPQSLEIPSAGGRKTFAFYYPPCNPEYRGLEGEKPPLIVRAHGGPTANNFPCYSPEIYFWTSRGFAYLDVNYGGSTGYGRAYRELLKGRWGIVDVEDCIAAALYCAEQGLADRQRLTIQGGSAGGYTTLAALASSDVFRAGASYYGVSDLEKLAQDTHKFEARYLDQLIGPYPERKDLYEERSPIHHIDRIHSPIIIFQGDEDAVVPPSQSELMYNSLRSRNIPTEYHLYQGEQHGFRKAENIAHALEAQLAFYLKVLRIRG